MSRRFTIEGLLRREGSENRAAIGQPSPSLQPLAVRAWYTRRLIARNQDGRVGRARSATLWREGAGRGKLMPLRLGPGVAVQPDPSQALGGGRLPRLRPYGMAREPATTANRGIGCDSPVRLRGESNSGVEGQKISDWLPRGGNLSNFSQPRAARARRGTSRPTGRRPQRKRTHGRTPPGVEARVFHLKRRRSRPRGAATANAARYSLA
jgi:hypothetical protein